MTPIDLHVKAIRQLYDWKEKQWTISWVYFDISGVQIEKIEDMRGKVAPVGCFMTAPSMTFEKIVWI